MEWCHLCGIRSTNGKIDIFYPNNAEHGGKDEKYVRVCIDCVRLMNNVLTDMYARGPIPDG
jgi:hypothetical protein